MRNIWRILGKTIILSLVLIPTAVFAFFFFNCVENYSEPDVDYHDLIYEELTFTGYKRINQYKSAPYYEIYFKEYNRPFQVTSISAREINITLLRELEENETLNVFYRQDSHKNYESKICEISYESGTLLSLDDYNRAYQKNDIVGMIISPLMVLMGLYLVWECNQVSKRRKLQEQRKFQKKYK